MKLGTRAWGLITVIVVIALVAGGYFLGAAPLLDQQAKAEAARLNAVATNQTLEGEIARLQKAEEDLDEYQALAADFGTLIPDSVDSQRFIRSLDTLAAGNGVTITKIAIEQFIPYTAPAVDPDAAGSEKAPPPYTDSRINDKNFVIVPVSVTVEGGWAESLSFVHALQFGDRLMLFTSIDQSTTDTAYSTEIKGYIYVLVPPGAPAPAPETVEGGSDSQTETAAAG